MHPTKLSRKIRPLQLIAIIFFTVSGGPYGLEPLLLNAGEHGALLLLLLTPLLWDVPAILTVAELNSMMPVAGGYYQWVKRALGDRLGFYEGWWTWLYTFIDLAIYPGLFVEYASFFYPELQAYKLPVCLTIIWAAAGLNIIGIVPVGKTAVWLSVLVFAPFIILFVMAFGYHHLTFHLPAPSIKGVPYPMLGTALYTVMWNCLGWDNVTTYAQEVEKPVRSYLISIAITFGLVIALYFLVIVVAQQSGVNAAKLNDEGFPMLGVLLGGRWLGILIAAGGMLSSIGIYTAVLLSVSRIPKVMADDGLLPKKLNLMHSRFDTPYVSIIICSIVVSFMVLWSFKELLIIDVTVYGAGLSLEYISLIRLRIKAPDEHRPFKIPLGITGLCLLLIFPFGVYFAALAGAFASNAGAIKAALFAIGTLLTAELVWQMIRWRRIYVEGKTTNL